MRMPVSNDGIVEIPLERIDVGQPHLYAENAWGTYFKRLRKEAPVHYCSESSNGPYWSVTRHADVRNVDTDHRRFSSEIGGITIADVPDTDEVKLNNFIAMDEPVHSAQRKTVSPVVSPAAMG